jgi:carboxymethylenebutenolidase
VELVKTAVQGKPDTTVYVYEGADHGFNCDQRGSYHPEAARLAWSRTMGHFAKHLR